MTAGGKAGFVRLTVALWAFIVLDGVFIAVSLAYLVGAFLLGGSIAHWGWGHVPSVEMRPFQYSLAAYQALVPFRNVGLILLAIWVIFESARAIVYFGVKPRFWPWLAAILIFVPIINLYVPYAALGDARKTMRSIAGSGVAPAEPIRGYDAFTIWLAIVSMVAFLVQTGLEAGVSATAKPTDTAGGMRLMATIEATLVGETIAGLLYLAVFATYHSRMLRFFRRALAAVAVADASRVFGDAPGSPAASSASSTDAARA